MKICDRCKKNIFEDTGIVITFDKNSAEIIDLCRECATDIANIIEMELKPEETKIYDVDYKEI